VPDHSHARHRAGKEVASRRQTTSKRQTTSGPSRILTGLALPTAATVALMFCAAGAAVATSPRTPNQIFSQSAAAMASQRATAAETAAKRAHLLAVERAQAAATASALQEIDRATEVARSDKRKKLAAAADVAKRAAFAHSWRLPITNPVTTSGFGYRWGLLHAGEDFAVSVGTALASMSTGTVVFAGAESGFGNLVEIRYWDGTISYFGHMSRISVNVGEAVAPAQIVGESGNTGHSTGPHLHLEIHPNGGEAIDPLPWLAAHHIAV
jgi:murein DD-endopeptidase MepM/ murein hydrolase activator NlpD